MKTIRTIREEKGISKVSISRHLGVSRPCYSGYENNPSTMRIETAIRVADFLGVDVQDIFFISDSK